MHNYFVHYYTKVIEKMSENVVACLIDALMVIIAERNNATITLELNSFNKSEWIELHSTILSGEATKNKLQEVYF